MVSAHSISRIKGNILITLCLAAILLAGLTFPAAAVVGDYNGDNKSEVISVYSYDNQTTRIWGFKGDISLLAPDLLWTSNTGKWDGGRSKTEAGNFDGDGNGWCDVAILYDYGGDTSRLWNFISDGTKLTPNLAWSSAPGGFNAARAKITAGDYNNDGRCDLAMLYDYGGSTSRLWLFVSDGSKFTPHIAWASSPGSFNTARVKITTGDYDGDGVDDICMLYDYGGATARAWTFISDGNALPKFNPNEAWYSGKGNFDVHSAKMVSGRFNNDIYSDIATLYGYGNSTSRIWTMIADGGSPPRFTPNQAWYSNPGNFDTSRSKMVGGDFDSDGFSDIGILYNYRSATSRVWTFKSSGDPQPQFTPAAAWYSGAGKWEWYRTKLAGGSTFIPRYVLSAAKSIDINLSSQTLTCYENSLLEWDEDAYIWTNKAVFSTLVSSGRSPFDTPAGNFSVYYKDPSVDMSGFGGTAEYYYVPNVPYVLWFTGNYSIHGAYWHNDFGNVRSHGCVNTPVDAAAWIYSWAPVGTPVNVHY